MDRCQLSACLCFCLHFIKHKPMDQSRQQRRSYKSCLKSILIIMYYYTLIWNRHFIGWWVNKRVNRMAIHNLNANWWAIAFSYYNNSESEWHIDILHVNHALHNNLWPGLYSVDIKYAKTVESNEQLPVYTSALWAAW